MHTYTGGCHCGAVTFTIEADLTKALECNCSHCYQKGFLLAFIPGENLKVLSGENNLTEYRFNKKFIAHLFCKTCGVQVFGRAKNPEGKETVAVNLRCLNDVNLDSLTIEKFDGKNL